MRGVKALIPEQMVKLRIIIEYFDCIIQAKDITSYQEINDEVKPFPAYRTFQKESKPQFNPVLLGQKLTNSKASIVTDSKKDDK